MDMSSDSHSREVHTSLRTELISIVPACTALGKLTADQIPAWREEGLKSHLWSRQWIPAGRERVGLECCSSKLTTLQQKATHPRTYGQYKLGLMGEGGIRDKVGLVRRGRDLGGVKKGKYNQNTWR